MFTLEVANWTLPLEYTCSEWFYRLSSVHVTWMRLQGSDAKKVGNAPFCRPLQDDFNGLTATDHSRHPCVTIQWVRSFGSIYSVAWLRRELFQLTAHRSLRPVTVVRQNILQLARVRVSAYTSLNHSWSIMHLLNVMSVHSVCHPQLFLPNKMKVCGKFLLPFHQSFSRNVCGTWLTLFFRKRYIANKTHVYQVNCNVGLKLRFRALQLKYFLSEFVTSYVSLSVQLVNVNVSE